MVEVIVFPEGCKSQRAYVTDRERHWIETMNSVDDGYNTVRPSGINPQQELELNSEVSDIELEPAF